MYEQIRSRHHITSHHVLPESRFSSAGTLLGRPGDLLGEKTELVLTSSEDVSDRLVAKRKSKSVGNAMGMENKEM